MDNSTLSKVRHQQKFIPSLPAHPGAQGKIGIPRVKLRGRNAIYTKNQNKQPRQICLPQTNNQLRGGESPVCLSLAWGERLVIVCSSPPPPPHPGRDCSVVLKRVNLRIINYCTGMWVVGSLVFSLSTFHSASLLSTRKRAKEIGCQKPFISWADFLLRNYHLV